MRSWRPCGGWWMRFAVIAGLIGCGAVAAAGTGSTPLVSAAASGSPFRSPGWSRIEEQMGAILLDGTLRRKYPLGGDDLLERLGWQGRLEHRVETDARGQAGSVWRIPALQTYLAPAGRGTLQWQPPGGAPVRFDADRLGRALSEAGATGCRIREIGSGDYEIQAPQGCRYRYRHGLLVTVTHPILGERRILAQGGLLREIRDPAAPVDAPPALQADYDDGGRCRRLQFGGATPHRFEWNEAGQLRRWTRPDGSQVRFEYRNNLLVRLTENSRPTETFRWENNPGCGRGDSRWRTPVHLCADNRHRYSYRLTAQGFVIEVRSLGGEPTVTVFNPGRRRVEQRGNRGTIVAIFRVAAMGRADLKQIVSGDGEVLEDYRYDAQGRLVGVKRRGEPDRTLRYDESGRLMALEGVTAQ